MPRSVAEWIGKTDNTPVPPRVKMRIFERHNGRCYLTGRKIMPGDEWDIEHIIALINGGEHREGNMAPALRIAHPEKTARDMKTKSKIARTRKRHVGIKSRKGRPMPGTKASGIRKRMSGQVERW